MNIEIKEVANLRDLKAFVRFPFSLYKGNKYWVPPLIKGQMETLRSDKNPAFKYCDVKLFLACKNGNLAGRVVGIINRKYVEKWKHKYAFFGWFDVIEDEDVSRALFKNLEEWAISEGMQGIHGPFGLTNFDQQGMLVDGFDELSTSASVYNFSYYGDHMEKLGYSKEIDYVEYRVQTPEEIPEKVVRIADIVRKRTKLKYVKSKSKKVLLPYSRQIFEVINVTYSHLFGFVPLNEEQIEIYTKRYLSYIEPDYLMLVLDDQEKLIGFYLAVPTMSKAFQKARGKLLPFGFIHILRALRNPKMLDLLLVGIIPDYQNKGINAVFMEDLNRIAIEKGISCVETNSEMEDNKDIRDFWKHFDAHLHKRKRVYIKSFS